VRRPIACQITTHHPGVVSYEFQSRPTQARANPDAAQSDPRSMSLALGKWQGSRIRLDPSSTIAARCRRIRIAFSSMLAGCCSYWVFFLWWVSKDTHRKIQAALEVFRLSLVGDGCQGGRGDCARCLSALLYGNRGRARATRQEFASPRSRTLGSRYRQRLDRTACACKYALSCGLNRPTLCSRRSFRSLLRGRVYRTFLPGGWWLCAARYALPVRSRFLRSTTLHFRHSRLPRLARLGEAIAA
jgi:hypothetical protein